MFGSKEGNREERNKLNLFIVWYRQEIRKKGNLFYYYDNFALIHFLVKILLQIKFIYIVKNFLIFLFIKPYIVNS